MNAHSEFMSGNVPTWGLQKLKMTAYANGMKWSEVVTDSGKERFVDFILAVVNSDEDLVVPDVEKDEGAFVAKCFKWLQNKFLHLEKKDVKAKHLVSFNGMTNIGLAVAEAGVEQDFALFIPEGAFVRMARVEARQFTKWEPGQYRKYVNARTLVHMETVLKLRGLGLTVVTQMTNPKGIFVYGPWYERLFGEIGTMRDEINAKILWRPVVRILTKKVNIVDISKILKVGTSEMIDNIIEVAAELWTKNGDQALDRYRKMLKKLATGKSPAEFYYALCDGAVMVNEPMDSIQFTAVIRASEKVGLGKGKYGYTPGFSLLNRIWGIDMRMGDVTLDCMKVLPVGRRGRARLTQVQNEPAKQSVRFNTQILRALPTCVAKELVTSSGWVSSLRERCRILKKINDGGASEKLFTSYRELTGVEDEDASRMQMFRPGIWNSDLRVVVAQAVAADVYNAYHSHRVEGEMCFANPDPALLPGQVTVPNGDNKLGERRLTFRSPTLNDYGLDAAVIVGAGNGGQCPLDAQFSDADWDGDFAIGAKLELKELSWKIVKKIRDNAIDMWIDGTLPDFSKLKQRYDARCTVAEQVKFCKYILVDTTGIGQMDAHTSRATLEEKEQREAKNAKTVYAQLCGKGAVNQCRSFPGPRTVKRDYWTQAGMIRRAKRGNATAVLIDQRKHRLEGLDFDKLVAADRKLLRCDLGTSGEFKLMAFMYGNKAIVRLRTLLDETFDTTCGHEDPRFSMPSLNVEAVLNNLPSNLLINLEDSNCFRPYFGGIVSSDVEARRRYVRGIAHLIWIKQVGSAEVAQAWGRHPSSVYAKLAQELRRLDGLSIYNRNATKVHTVLVSYFTSTEGREKIDPLLRRLSGLSIEGHEKIDPLLRRLSGGDDSYKYGWLNALELIKLQEERSRLLKMDITSAEKDYWKSKMFNTPRPLHFWLRTVLRQFCLGYRVKERGQWVRVPSVYRQKAGRYCNSTELVVDCMYKPVAELLSDLLLGKTIGDDRLFASSGAWNRKVEVPNGE